MKLQQTKRHQVKLRLGLSGASGFGKSYSALLLAFGITNDWSKIAIIDTENGSASLYSHLGGYNVLPIDEPYSPERYIEAVKTCENASMEVVIIDSITHEWNGNGGCLDIHSKLGGRFADWSIVTPRHQAFIDAILKSKCHIITTVRKKMDYSMDRDSNGKTKVIKHGLKDITREGFSYELTVDFELINDNHLAKASKDRTGLFTNKPEFVINASTGKKLIAWCNEGISIERISQEIEDCVSIEELKHIYTKHSSVQNSIKPLILKRKEELETIDSQLIDQKEIVKPSKTENNGIDSK
ncbi:ATP-binding protein [Lacinutrix sp. C3R15]|uniref:AAA family ATPase n=1 Tax=Flavobacteriaceae TaxID=49546 RepID=UPI001C0900EE|nr:MULTISPECIES: AAA family ATPase [Flavobacteriaceae]MBU2940157.1 ATP-binding protein [Lacinutrix sp. C3R15]MDO6623474.1 AAA family ATPase [Oceanihabitans sp. 1_MG-2023]